jgi:glycosyltransferase involved in cell wall biosynthesis
MQIDFHVHSKFSKRPSQWILQKIGCPESFTDPVRLYQIARHRGMDWVTITDHNTLDGSLAIAHLPNTIVGEEITSYFPEDQCKVHIVALNLSESQHQDIQHLRPNVLELVPYLNQENIFHVIAHPLYAINDRLTLAHFEKMLLLFKNFELNGSRNHRENRCLQAVLDELTPDLMAELAHRHDIAPVGSDPCQKRLFSGSDDHSALNIGRAFTRISKAVSPLDYFTDPDRYVTEPVIHPATPRTMAHNLYGIAYQFFRDRFNLERYSDKDPLIRFLDARLRTEPTRPQKLLSKIYFFFHRPGKINNPADLSDSLIELLQHESRKFIKENPQFLTPEKAAKEGSVDPAEASPSADEDQWFEFVNRIANKVMSHSADHFMDHLSGANVFNIFHTLGSTGGLYALLAPYFVSYSLFNRDQQLSQRITARFDTSLQREKEKTDHLKVALFTDTYHEVNGVALTLRQQSLIAHRRGMDLTLVTCYPQQPPQDKRVRNFQPVGVYQLPEYEEQQLVCPPFLEMLDYCYRHQFTQIHTSAPGPLGLAALVIARLLKLPISGTYHTAIPQYAHALTSDANITELTWRYTLWFYQQLDVVYAPSQSTRHELMGKGLNGDKIRVYPRGIDTERFHPSKSNGFYRAYPQLTDRVKLLYVGRVSKEKNMPLLVSAFRRLVEMGLPVGLVVVGDGPYREQMMADTAGLPCEYCGYLKGHALEAAYASSDVFVFPSTTDTFGNVVLEAQASGLPVIVSDEGGPQENLEAEVTGVVIKGDDGNALAEAMIRLSAHPELRRRMGAAARRYAEQRSFEAAFLKTWQMYHDTTASSQAVKWPQWNVA